MIPWRMNASRNLPAFSQFYLAFKLFYINTFYLPVNIVPIHCQILKDIEIRAKKVTIGSIQTYKPLQPFVELPVSCPHLLNVL